MWNNIFVMAILHAKALRDNTELGKAQSLIQMKGMDIGCYNSIELEYTETKAGAYSQRVPH